MPRRSRAEKRIIQDQETVGMQRAVRKEQEELTSKKKRDAAQAKALEMNHEKAEQTPVKLRRVARVGKPLKR
jgi:hypothetical protein